MARTRTFNRQQEDIGNILSMEHVNLRVPDQTTAAWFYVSGLGLTRDPFVDFGSFNTWINVGAQQFHLPTGKPQVLRGEVHITVPNLDELEHRLNAISGRLKDTLFFFKRTAKEVVAQCPWGNTIRCRGESTENRAGMHGVSFKVDAAALSGINRFYQQIFKCPTKISKSKKKLNKKDIVMIFSVGGGDIKKKISVNLVNAISDEGPFEFNIQSSDVDYLYLPLTRLRGCLQVKKIVNNVETNCVAEDDYSCISMLPNSIFKQLVSLLKQ